MRDILSEIDGFRSLGDHLMAIGHHASAAKAYHKALTHGGDAILLWGDVAVAHLHARMASALLSDDLFLEASAYASEAISLAERNPYVRYVHAHMLYSEGGDGEAMDTLDDLSVALELQPWVNVARAEFDPTSVDASVLRGILTDAVSRAPVNGALLSRLSLACEATGHHIDALQHARVAAWLQPWLLRRWYRYGTASMLANVFTEAATAFDSARDVSPFDAGIEALVARAHLLAGDIDAAAASVVRGLRKRNGHADCQAVLHQLVQYNPASMAPALLRLDADLRTAVDKEPFIFVPTWCGSASPS